MSPGRDAVWTWECFVENRAVESPSGGEKSSRAFASGNPRKIEEIGWRRGWDSNPVSSCRVCNLQILSCQGCRKCQGCRGTLLVFTRWLCCWAPLPLDARREFEKQTRFCSSKPHAPFRSPSSLIRRDRVFVGTLDLRRRLPPQRPRLSDLGLLPMVQAGHDH